MTVDITFHYPPELMNLLIDTIPLLNRSKNDVFLFFRGSGVTASLMKQSYDQWRRDRDSINKYEIVRHVLTALNEGGEQRLRERREVLKRIVEFEDFSTCWPADHLKAKGLVSEIRRVINVKDSFTRIHQERDRERSEHIAQREREIEVQRRVKSERDQIKSDLYALFADPNPSKRGTALEDVLNRLFKSHGILVRESFKVVGDHGEGVVEQIDGVIECDGHIYLVEMKWWHKPLGVPEVSQHLVRVYHRNAARGILISHSGYTAPAIATCKDALQKSVFVMCTLQELVLLLERDESLLNLLREKVRVAITNKQPFLENTTVTAQGGL